MSVKHQRHQRTQREKQRALALAALTQTAFLITIIAREGKCDERYFNPCLDALLDDDYIAERHFSLGNSLARRILQGSDIGYGKDIAKYVSAMMAVEKKLAKQPQTLRDIGEGMQRIHKQVQYFSSPYHDNIIAAIAHLYGETISHIKPRIIIHGKAEHLKQQRHTERVRCLLFSGIRAAWVWRTHGGSMWKLMLGRRQLLRQLRTLASTS